MMTNIFKSSKNSTFQYMLFIYHKINLFSSLIGWRWKEVKNNLAGMGFIILSGLAKLGFHRAHIISSKVPESCLLIILGVLFGGLLYLFFRDECSVDQTCLDYDHLVFPKFTPELFFLYLLPPIILEAAYCLHNEHFFDNIRSILMFAVFGTVINFVITGGLLILVKVSIRQHEIYNIESAKKCNVNILILVHWTDQS